MAIETRDPRTVGIAIFRPDLLKRKDRRSDWSNQEVADFYRAVDILKKAGLDTEVDLGLTDEGDPWFVFIRPATGDVIAHFAKIDGEFIAVSSLNHEVYKGKNVRQIVDRMLASHPAVIPQKSNGSRLLLHPTAAISAFLAAAYILTIDGVVAKTLEEVILEGASSNVEEDRGGLWLLSSILKSEPLKNIFSDTSVSNYNVSVLGAALIPHDMLIQDPDHAETVEFVEKFNGIYVNADIDPKAQDTDAGVPSVSARDTSYGAVVKEADNFENFRNDTGAVVLNEELTNVSANNMEVNTDSDLGLMKTLMEASTNLERTSEEVFEGSGLFLNSNGEIDDRIIQPTQLTQYRLVQEVSLDNETNSVSASFSDSSQILSDFFREGYFALEANTDPEKNGVGITLDVTGGFQLVSFEYNLQDDGVRLQTFTAETIFPKLELIDNQSILDAPKNSERHIDKTSFDVLLPKDDSFAPTKAPILGHSFRNPEKILELTTAIDVVFYRGGDAEISGFELGKDLLWFFLSSEELLTAKNEINHKGDLVLDFAGTGTLTFLGVVESMPMETVI